MEDWLATLKSNASKKKGGEDVKRILAGQHAWHATYHARPTYCNVCRDQLSGVTSHGLSCEVCKCKVHKRCAVKAISNCKWATLASIGKDIVEDKHGNILMPHQWMEGNLPVSAKCAVCEKTCGSVLRLQDWRCLWCRTTVHTACRPKHSIRCPLGPNHLSVVPPTAIHSNGTDDAWEAVRPHGCSPLLVFVNSKSGDNQGVKFLRRFRQILNPVQVFDLISIGPTPGLKLFRHFDPFRVLICSGDGSVGWVLKEIDRLNMQLQCEVGVLPLGTGNDLARVLGWGASCDDDTHLPQLLERYERASPRILDRWSIMTLPREIKVDADTELTLGTNLTKENNLVSTATACEDSVLTHLTKIIQSDQHSVVISSAKVLCETVRDFITKISHVTLMQGDEDFSDKCQFLKTKLEHLLQILKDEESQVEMVTGEASSSSHELQPSAAAAEKHTFEIREKNTSLKLPEQKKVKKDQLLLRVNSLKKAVRRVVEHTEKIVDEQHIFSGETKPVSLSKTRSRTLKCEKSLSSQSSRPKQETSDELHLSPVSPGEIPNVTSISPLPEVRRTSSSSNEISLASLPVPKEFADSRHNSLVEESEDKCGLIYAYFVEPNTYHFESNFSSSNDVCQEKHDKPKEYSESEEDTEEEIEEEELDMSYKHSNFREEGNSVAKKFVGSLSEELANIGHIDSSETSDDSPEGCGDPKNDEKSLDVVNRSTKGSEYSFPISIEGGGTLGSDVDTTNLFSTSPEEEEECSEEYRKAMGLDMAKRCSIAHFIEGSDIAKRSIKCRHRKKSVEELDRECVAVSPEQNVEHPVESKCASVTTVLEIPKIEVFNDESSASGSSVREGADSAVRCVVISAASVDRLYLPDADTRPDRRSCTLSETDDEELVQFRGLNKGETMANSSSTGPTVIIDPPSPPSHQEIEEDDTSAEHDGRAAIENFHKMSRSCRRLSAASPLMSVHCSPSPTRRISNSSVMGSDISEQKDSHSSGEKHMPKTLPIINPLVRLPQWPNVSETGTGMISKVLLANADALCAAAVPLMDPDEILLEGFTERCVMNNYFGIGIDAKISLDFHIKREECPHKCRSRALNFVWYGLLGSKQWVQKSCKNLEQKIQLECDGHRIPLPSLQGIVILNIPSFMGGINFWGGTRKDDIFLSPSMDDRILEVVAVFGTAQMAASRFINLQHHRIAQCSCIQIAILGDEGVPIQVDGEAWIQPPGLIRIIHKNRMKMLCRNKSLESSLKVWEEKQRQIRHQNRLQSNVGKLTALTEEEMNILLAFIEATTSLIKCVKLLSIRQQQQSLGADLYKLANAVEVNLERVHPDGQILQGLELRPVVTELVISAQRLVEETNTVMRDKNLEITSEIERQLNSSILQMEIELKKCFFAGSSQHSFVYLRLQSPDEQDRKITYGRKSSAGTFWQRFRRNSGVSATKYTRKEVVAWDVGDVTTWLESIQLGEYAESFTSNDVRGRELLTLTRTDLKELGVSKVGHVKRLLLAIKEFVP